MKDKNKRKKFVKERYAEIAAKETSCCAGCECGFNPLEQSKLIGYSDEEIRSLPEGSILGLGCGNPTALADLKEGETVLDLGSGSGLDVFLAAKKVGEKGKVIGLDMTPEMIEKARENAKKGDYKNVEFRIGEIENMPVESNTVDVVISNCVINLAEDKFAVYKEIFRVLKPQGRFLISDLVTKGNIPTDIRQSFEAWAGCIAGAMERKKYLAVIKESGFRRIEIVGENPYAEPAMDDRLKGKIISLRIKAYKVSTRKI